jgi:hypothetical protein
MKNRCCYITVNPATPVRFIKFLCFTQQSTQNKAASDLTWANRAASKLTEANIAASKLTKVNRAASKITEARRSQQSNRGEESN